MSQADQSNTGFEDVGKYDWAEYDYPGYEALIHTAANVAVEGRVNHDLDIIEIGPGAGATTEKLALQNVKSIKAIEISPECAAYLAEKVSNGMLPATEIVQADFINWAAQPEQRNSADVEVSTFTMHHVARDRKSWAQKLAASANVLREGGKIVVGDAFLPAHDETDPKARVDAHIDLHSDIIIRQFEAGKLQLPFMEFEALASGLATVDEFINDQGASNGHAIYANDREQPHPANIDAIVRLQEMLERAESATQQLKETHTDHENPDEPVAVKRQEFINKIKGTIRGLEESTVAGIDPKFFEANPDVCSIGACDYKVTLRQYTEIHQQQGYEVEGWKIGSDEGRKTLDKANDYAGGLWVTRASRHVENGQTGHVL